MSTLLWVLGISLSISFLCSILEAVLLSVTHSYVGLLRERGERAGEFLHALLSKIDEPIAAILTLNTIAHTMGATLGGAIALQVLGDELMAAFSVILTLVILMVPISIIFWMTLVLLFHLMPTSGTSTNNCNRDSPTTPLRTETIPCKSRSMTWETPADQHSRISISFPSISRL